MRTLNPETMPALFVFLLKVNIALIVFWLGYYLVLRRLTFYTLNRIYLCIAIIFSSVYPLIKLDNFVQKHNIPVQRVIVDWKIPAGNSVGPLVQQTSYWQWATLLFWIGAALFATRLLMQLLSLYKLHKNSNADNIQNHGVRIVKANISPFSFWQSIYINPDNLDPADLKSVLQHEQVHVQEWHTLDILLTEISAIFYWFNPGIWLIKKAVRENIEFITDRRILQRGMDSKAYQYSLLNVSFSATTAAGIINNFNFSTLKKRIIMMNAKRSSNANLTLYAFLVPAVCICLLTIGLSKAELVKKSKIAYKRIAASVNTSANNLAKITGLTSAAPITKPVITLSADTVKRPKEKVMTISSFAIVDGDTIKKTNFRIDNNVNDSLNYFINERKVTKADFLNLSRTNIATVTVETNAVNSQKSLYIVTKDNHDLLLTSTIHGYFQAKQEQAPDINIAKTIKDDSILLKQFTRNREAITTSSKSNTNNQMITGSIIIDNNDNTSEKTQNQAVDKKTNPLDEILIIADGKEITANELFALANSKTIQSVLVQGPGNKAMVDKYGDKAKKGVMIVTTKNKS